MSNFGGHGFNVNVFFRLTEMCLEGWHHFNDKCYRYFSQPKTWLNAYYYCQGQFGAKLATIDSSEENE